MSRSGRSGVTLIELSIAMFLMVLILGAISTLFVQSRQNFERPRASMAAQEQMMRIVRWLSQDLEETNVQSIRSFPNPSDANASPGLSLLSPRESSVQPEAGQSPDTFPTTAGIGVNAPFGTVTWKKYVYYTLQPNPTQRGVGNLIRNEGPLTDQPNPADPNHLIPVGSPLDPDTTNRPQPLRVLAQDVVLPNQTVVDSHGKVIFTAGASGGFQVFFPTAGTPVPPPFSAAATTAFDFNSRGLPVVVNLALEDVSQQTGQATVNTFQLQFVPRN